MTQEYLERYYQNYKRNYLNLHNKEYPLIKGDKITNYSNFIKTLDKPLVLSFDFHDTLTAHNERVMSETDSLKFSQLINEIITKYNQPIIPIIHSVGNIFTTHKINLKNEIYLITEGHILFNDHLSAKENITLLDHNQSVIDDKIKKYIKENSPKTRLVDHDQDELLIQLSTIPNIENLDLSNQELSKKLSDFLPKELANQASFWINRYHDILGIHTRIGKNQISQKLLTYLGYNPKEYTYIHFGDHTPDILWEGTDFLEKFLITPYNSSQKTKDYASYTDQKHSPDNILIFLEKLASK